MTRNKHISLHECDVNCNWQCVFDVVCAVIRRINQIIVFASVGMGSEAYLCIMSVDNRRIEIVCVLRIQPTKYTMRLLWQFNWCAIQRTSNNDEPHREFAAIHRIMQMQQPHRNFFPTYSHFTKEGDWSWQYWYSHCVNDGFLFWKSSSFFSVFVLTIDLWYRF